MAICPSCGKSDMSHIGMHISQTDCEWPELSGDSLDVIRGVLMGDGCIWETGNSAVFEVQTTNPTYLHYLKTRLPDWLTTNSGVRLTSVREGQRDLYKLSSRSLPLFEEMREEWYPDGEKVFPESVTLNETVLRHWYCTDGGLKWSNSNHGRYFDGVSLTAMNEIERKDELRERIPYETGPMNSQGTIVISVNDSKKFLSDIGPFVPGFEYKWETESYEEYRAKKKEAYGGEN